MLRAARKGGNFARHAAQRSQATPYPFFAPAGSGGQFPAIRLPVSLPSRFAASYNDMLCKVMRKKMTLRQPRNAFSDPFRYYAK